MTLEQSSFFSCRGYALAALSLLAWAARAIESGDGDAVAARAWVAGKVPQPDSLSFGQCVQACGLSSRREELRAAFTDTPSQALARLLVVQEAVRGDGDDLGAAPDEEDGVEEQLRAMRSFHVEQAFQSFGPAAGEVSC